MKLTKPMRKLLADFVASGGDAATISMTAELTRISNKRAYSSMARTMLALLRVGALRIAKGGGLEVSEAGRKAVTP